MSANENSAPARAGLVLGSLIAVAAVANLGLAVANVALPSIGEHFDASQTSLNLIAVGYSLGLAAGMAYPATLALITALWSGPARTRAIALWAATGGAIAALGPLCSGILLEHFWWGSVFLLTLPLAVAALLLALKFVPAHVNETTEPADNPGGVLSIVMVGALILGINSRRPPVSAPHRLAKRVCGTPRFRTICDQV